MASSFEQGEPDSFVILRVTGNPLSLKVARNLLLCIFFSGRSNDSWISDGRCMFIIFIIFIDHWVHFVLRSAVRSNFYYSTSTFCLCFDQAYFCGQTRHLYPSKPKIKKINPVMFNNTELHRLGHVITKYQIQRIPNTKNKNTKYHK